MKNYDLTLSDWGPYNKFYLGAAHVADKKKGIRFDLNLFPGLYRKSVILPKDNSDSGTKIMESSIDLSHFVYRYELIWKDELYIDADFLSGAPDNLQIKCKIVNTSSAPQSVTLNACASLGFPTFYRKPVEVTEPVGTAIWIDAVDYSKIETKQFPAVDALKLGECRKSGFVYGSAIDGTAFGETGVLEYQCPSITADKLYIRYSSEEDFHMDIEINGEKYGTDLDKSDEILNFCLPIRRQKITSFSVTSDKAAYFLDGFIIGENDLAFPAYSDDFMPKITKADHSLILDYSCGSYRISWDFDNYEIREFFGSDIGTMLSDCLHNHTSAVLNGCGKGHFSNIFLRPIFLNANSERTVTINVEHITDNTKSCKNNTKLIKIPANSDGEKFKLSQQIMAATTLTNVVFPVYCKGEYIKHNTPGRQWDCLYTWDSGFIGMGLNTISEKRAVECLNTYLTEIGDIHSPLIFHGSVVPTQMLLFHEIWNTRTNTEFLEKFYPYMRQYYMFFRNRCKTDTGLGKTWDIFYSSGGWDDYPPQVYVNTVSGMKDKTYPVITTSITVLCAKIMKNMALKLGLDASGYDEDIKELSKSIQENCWDEETGYFGYAVAENGKVSILKYNGQINYDMGLDGVYPYIAGICTDAQKTTILNNIRDGLMTEYGCSAVDTRAPYYRTDGYWNGSVWMPHQWILWKSLLDEGNIELANKISSTALSVWETEVSLTYNCCEHFMNENGRGAGFHQFSGLSTPVLMWYRAYYTPGTISTGFRTMLDAIKWNDDFSELVCDILITDKNSCIIICLNEEFSYDFYIDDWKISAQKLTNGAYFINASTGRLSAVPK